MLIVFILRFRNINTGTFSRCRAIVPLTVTQRRAALNAKIRVKRKESVNFGCARMKNLVARIVNRSKSMALVKIIKRNKAGSDRPRET